MKKIAFAMIGMMTLCTHSEALEAEMGVATDKPLEEVYKTLAEELETRLLASHSIGERYRIFEEYQAKVGAEAWARLRGNRFSEVSDKVNAEHEKARTLIHAFSIEELCKVLEERFDDQGVVNSIMLKFYFGDGCDLSSYGDQEALDWTRKMLREKKSGQGWDKVSAMRYLIMKGNEQDLGLIIEPWRENLAMRIAGTNLLNYFAARIQHQVVRNGIYDIVPSITNTGPQAHYVLEILRQFWQKMDPPTDTYCGISKDMSQIPDELITMVVWFDEDGNPVCNVDLAKYGLTMPELDVPNRPKPKPKVATASLPSEDEAQRLEAVATMDDTPPNRLYLYIAILCATLCSALVVAYKKRNSKTKN